MLRAAACRHCRASRARTNALMQASARRSGTVLVVCLFSLFVAAAFLYSRAAQAPSSAVAQKPAPHVDPAEAYRLNTLGVAYMNQQRPADAQKLFEQSLGADPTFEVARLNLGISLLAQQKLEPARTALAAAAEKLPQDPYAWYNLGLVYKDLGDAEKGVGAFMHVTQIANEADPWYFVGYLNSQLQHYDQAIAAFQKALAIFPFHASAEFGLARAYQRGGKAEAAKEHLAKFQKMTADHVATPFGAGYGDQGRFSLAELPRSSAQNAPPAIPVHFVSQFLSTAISTPAATPVGPSNAACFFDYDNDGKPDLFLAGSDPTYGSHLLHNLGNGKFADVTKPAGLESAAPGFGCAAGDFDNDGHTDLAVCFTDGVRLFHNTRDGKFEDVTEKVGIRREKGCVGATFVDYDHDGDLDLYVTIEPRAAAASETAAHNILWR